MKLKRLELKNSDQFLHSPRCAIHDRPGAFLRERKR